MYRYRYIWYPTRELEALADNCGYTDKIYTELFEQKYGIKLGTFLVEQFTEMLKEAKKNNYKQQTKGE